MEERPQLNAIMVWEDLILLTKNVVEAMNRVDELRNRTGGLEFQLGKDHGIIVDSPVLSAAVNLLPDTIEIRYIIASRDRHPLDEQSREILKMEIHQCGQYMFRTVQGDAWTVEQTIYHILRPFLHLGTAHY